MNRIKKLNIMILVKHIPKSKIKKYPILIMVIVGD
jgi:hypothetical protein